MLGGALAVSIVFLYFMFNLVSAPSYSLLMAGLQPDQTGKMTAALDAKAIPYQLQNGGTALAVESDKTSQARIALATAGLLGPQQHGFELFDSQQLGASNFQQQVTYQRALQGELAQSIEQVQGVTSAQVNLVLPNPQDQLFQDNTTPASAAVLLSDSGTLDPSAVKGIAEMVASSVPGLSDRKVTITDSTGQLLWPTSSSTVDGSAATKQDAEARYDAAMASQLTAMLSQTLGPGKAQVEVNADLNANQATSDALVYGKKGTALQSHIETESLTGGSGSTGTAATSAATTAGQVPAYAQGAAGPGAKYNHKITDGTFGVNKTVTHTVIAPGAVNRQSVSVLVDSSVPASAIPALKAAVTSAAGLVPGRGDTVSFGQVAFAKPTVAPTPPGANPLTTYGKYGAIGIGSVVFLFFVMRALRRREREGYEPTWLHELEVRRPIGAIGQGTEESVTPLRTASSVTRRQVEELVDRDANRVAQHLRDWMSEED